MYHASQSLICTDDSIVYCYNELMGAIDSGSEAFESFCTSVPEDLINKVLLMCDKHHRSVLHAAARHVDEVAFVTFVNRASSDALDHAVTLCNFHGCYVLHEVACSQREAGFFVLMKKLSISTLNSALSLQNDARDTLLHSVFQYQPEKSVLQFLEIVSAEALSEALVLQAENLWTALHVGARYLSETGFRSFIAKASDAALSQAVPVMTDKRWTAFQVVTQYQSGAGFLALIRRVKSDALLRAIPKLSVGGWNGLSTAARYQSETGFLSLLSIVSAQAVDMALRLNNQSGLLCFQICARHLSHTAYLFLLGKISDETLTHALVCQDAQGWTGLHAVIRFQVAENICATLARVSNEAVSRVLSSRNRLTHTVLTYAIKEMPEQLLFLLNKCKEWDIRNAVLIAQGRYAVQTIVTRLWLTTDEEWQQYPGLQTKLVNVLKCNSNMIIRTLLSLLPTYIHREAIHASQSALLELFNEISTLHHLHLAFQSRKCLVADRPFSFAEESTVKHKQLLGRMQTFASSANRFLRQLRPLQMIIAESVHLSTQEAIVVNALTQNQIGRNENLCQTIWHAGLASWLEYIALIRYCGEDSVVAMTLLMMNTMHKVLSGVPKEIAWPSLAIQSTQSILSLVRSANCLVKVVTPGKVDAFLSTLADYQVRPCLRMTKESKPQYKFRHLTGTIESYPSNKIARLIKAKQRTRKTAVTWIGSSMITPLFGMHNDPSNTVGFAFDRRACVIKAMLASDAGTYEKGWLGSERDVVRYAQRISLLNFTSESAFIKFIETSLLVNEVLAELTKDALVAIVVASEVMYALDIAKDYQAKVKDKLGLDLPIVIYDPSAQLLLPYDHHEQTVRQTQESTASSTRPLRSRLFRFLFKSKDRLSSEAEKKLAAQLCFSP